MLRLGISQSYVWELVFLRLEVSQCYVRELVFLRFGVGFFKFGG